MDANETGAEPGATTTIDATLWAFLRGDMAVRDFELWIYSDDSLETVFGAELYLTLISADWRDRHAVARLIERLEAFGRLRLACECMTLRDLDVLPMGFTDRADRFFSTVGHGTGMAGRNGGCLLRDAASAASIGWGRKASEPMMSTRCGG